MSMKVGAFCLKIAGKFGIMFARKLLYGSGIII
jgi:hypothetical protein